MGLGELVDQLDESIQSKVDFDQVDLDCDLDFG